MTKNPLYYIKTLARNTTLALSIALMLVTAPSVGAQESITSLDLYSINGNTSHYDPTSRCAGQTSISATTPGTLPSNIPPAWRDVLTKAAAAKSTSVTLLAALYLTENGNTWKDFDSNWSTSSSGALGPMQFLPGTWDGHKQDGNGDGKMDVQNVWDAVFAAADMIADMGAKPNSPLGDLQQPMTRGTQTYYGAAYNHGPGWAERTSPTTTLAQIDSQETREYVMNVHALVSSNFTKKGKPAYSDPKSIMKNPGTEVPSAGGASVTDVSTTAGGNKCCSASGGGKTIVLDPGHGGGSISAIDPITKLDVSDYSNDPEFRDAFVVADNVKARLEKDGYKVIMTKSKDTDNINLRDRAEKANTSKADLAVSIHTQADLPFATKNNIVYAQKVGQYRENKDGSNRHTFDKADIATLSQTYADVFVRERATAEGHPITLKTDATSDIGTRLPTKGSIWMVMLFSNVPWLYMEAGGQSPGKSLGLDDNDKTKYANGIYNSIVKSLPTSSGTSGTSCTSGGGGSGTGEAAANKAIELAWPDTGHGKLKQHAKPIYIETSEKLDGRKTEADFYSDCGVFVSTVVRSSGLDTKYPDRGTYNHVPYLLKNSQGPGALYTQIKTKDTGMLHPGDIFVFDTYPGGPGHTYMITKKPGDKYLARSASFHDHVPEATGVNFTQGQYTFLIFRKN